jgi:hypothetical protein
MFLFFVWVLVRQQNIWLSFQRRGGSYMPIGGDQFVRHGLCRGGLAVSALPSSFRGCNMNLQATYIVKFTSEQLHDLFITAIEGGCNYWCRSIEILDGDNNLVSHQDEDLFEREDIVFRVTTEDGQCTKRPTCLIQAVGECGRIIDFDNHDAEDADAWFQKAILGEIVYG